MAAGGGADKRSSLKYERHGFRIVSLRIRAAWRFFATPWAEAVIKRCNPAITAYAALNKITSQKAAAKKGKTPKVERGISQCSLKNYRDG